MKKILLPIVSILYLISFTGCEELGLDFRKLEFVINGSIDNIETFDTRHIDYAVLWNRSDILSVFDISEGAEIQNFWIRDLRVLYQACDVIEAESLDLNLYIQQPNAAIFGLAFASGVDLKNISKTVDPRKPFDLSITKQVGGVELLNGLLGDMINDEDKFINIIVEGQHHPAEALVCGAILIEMDVYIKYKECRLVPFGSEAGEPCE
jgi:hypothetical protein